MAKRISYKTWWQEAELKVERTADKVRELTRVCEQQREALAAFGRDIVRRPEFGLESSKDIMLPSHEFEAVESSLAVITRYVAEAPPTVGRGLFWRRHRVYKLSLSNPVRTTELSE